MERERPDKPKYRWKNVFVKVNLTTGRKYYERRKVRLPTPGEIPEAPPEVPSLTPPKDIGIPDWLAREKD